VHGAHDRGSRPFRFHRSEHQRRAGCSAAVAELIECREQRTHRVGPAGFERIAHRGALGRRIFVGQTLDERPHGGLGADFAERSQRRHAHLGRGALFDDRRDRQDGILRAEPAERRQRLDANGGHRVAQRQDERARGARVPELPERPYDCAPHLGRAVADLADERYGRGRVANTRERLGHLGPHGGGRIVEMPEERTHGFRRTARTHRRRGQLTDACIRIAEDAPERQHRANRRHVANELTRGKSRPHVGIAEPRDDDVDGRRASLSHRRFRGVQTDVEVGIAKRFHEQWVRRFLGQIAEAQGGRAALGYVAAVERPRDLGGRARPHERPGRRGTGDDDPTQQSGTPEGAHRPRLARRRRSQRSTREGD
jgi:hypothetical protein